MLIKPLSPPVKVTLNTHTEFRQAQSLLAIINLVQGPDSSLAISKSSFFIPVKVGD